MNFVSQSIKKISLVLVTVLFVLGSCSEDAGKKAEVNQKEFKSWKIPDVPESAEFYFSPDGKSLIGNVKFEGDSIHQVCTVNIDGSNLIQINDTGEDACSYYFPDGKRLIYTSTKDNLEMARGNWSDPNNYPQGAELYICSLDGNDVSRLTNNSWYDAEVSISPNGEWVLFTRQTDGMLDLWKIRPDGTEETQITNSTDWQEGGSFYLDNETIVYRAWETSKQAARGMPMTIFTIKSDGTQLKQITHDKGTNWAPHPAPDGEHFVFVKVLPPRTFEIFLMSIKTGKQTRLTYSDSFDGFPVISPDGQLLTFSSNRGGKEGSMKLFPYLMDISSLNLGAK